MKKIVFFAAAVFSGAISLFNQDLQHRTTVVNIEVPVRVFHDKLFDNNLLKEDFEVFEDGVRQKIEAVYLIDNTRIKRSDTAGAFHPETGRHFYLFFEISDYPQKIKTALKTFFDQVFTREDHLTVITPRKSYQFKMESLSRLTNSEITEQLGGILRRDAWVGSAEYRHIIHDLIVSIRNLTKLELPEFNLMHGFTAEDVDLTAEEKYLILRERLEAMRTVSQRRLLDFAEHLKSKKGQKHVFIFYQREFIPKYTTRMFMKIEDANRPAEQMELMTHHGYFFRDLSFDVDRVKRAYSDSSITINFLFFTKAAELIPGVQMDEHSEDIFSAFSAMSESTGGITTSSANPEFLFQRASDAVQNCYLVYYSVPDYRPDGGFRNIEVKVRGKGRKVYHRAGYYAD